jgi:choline dehydrogenase-like flavoprotein
VANSGLPGARDATASSLPSLDARERERLRHVVDTILPGDPSASDSLAQRSGSAAGVDLEIGRLFSSYFSEEDRAEFRRLLRTVGPGALSWVLSGHWAGIDGSEPLARERLLRRWSLSHLRALRTGFQVVARLSLFLYYGRADDGSTNPVWPAIGYAQPPLAVPRATPSFAPPSFDASSDGEIETEVCVIGSGAGGSVIAADLAAAGHRVLVLEAGPFRSAPGFPTNEAGAFDALYLRHGLLTTSDRAISILAGATAGGGTTVNWTTCLPTPELVRREWERGHGMAGVAGAAFSADLTAVMERLKVNSDESQINPSNEALRLGCERLGYQWGRDFQVIRRNAVGCRERCAPCSFGCPYGAKQSALETFLADAVSAGARLLCDTRADLIEVERGQVRGVHASWRSGGQVRTVQVRTRCAVVAAGAIETPALLLRSGIRHDGVGLGLRLHPTSALFSEFPHPVRMWEGPMQTIVVRRFQEMDGALHGPWIESAPAHPGLAAEALPWTGGAEHKTRMRAFGRTASAIVLVRDVGEGRVRIDSRGEAVVDYRLTTRDRFHLSEGLVEAAWIHRAAGAQRVQTLHLPELSAGDGSGPIRQRDVERLVADIRRTGIRDHRVGLFSAHPTGSARAGGDPRRAAARPTGEAYGTTGLWIGDGSILPTAPGVNPMVSIMAVARRTAGYIRQSLAAAASA